MFPAGHVDTPLTAYALLGSDRRQCKMVVEAVQKYVGSDIFRAANTFWKSTKVATG